MSVSAFNDDEFAVTENPVEKGASKSKTTERLKVTNATLRAIATRTASMDNKEGEPYTHELPMDGRKEATPRNPTQERKAPIRRQRAQKGPDRFPFRSMRKLARRGGVKRISKRALDAAMKYGEDFAKKVVELAIAYLDSGKRQTCRTSDVLQAFRVMGCSLYGADISSLGSS